MLEPTTCDTGFQAEIGYGPDQSIEEIPTSTKNPVPAAIVQAIPLLHTTFELERIWVKPDYFGCSTDWIIQSARRRE
jgi:hypothetical protein